MHRIDFAARVVGEQRADTDEQVQGEAEHGHDRRLETVRVVPAAERGSA